MSFFVLLLLGLPFVLKTETKNFYLGIGVCILVCIVFLLIDMACSELGERLRIAPAAAAWLPILIFGPIGFFMFDSVRT